MAAPIVTSLAPIRICDIGGWTDTWFAGHGAVLNLGVAPYVEVQLVVRERVAGEPAVVLRAENYGDVYGFDPGALPGRHPLLEAAVDIVGVPDGAAVDVSLHSDVPAGCSTGTSAAVTVALIGALAHVHGLGWSAAEVARAAHQVETDRLGLQSGVQDQLCSAHGGISFVTMPAYPMATATPVAVDDTTWWELDRRLLLVFLGRTHVSSAVHEEVIASLGPEPGAAPQLEELRRLAGDGRAALTAGDLDGFGRVMTANTEAQARLHPGLVSADARRVIAVAEGHGAGGWKVNGAGGEGGSMTVLCGPTGRDRRDLARALEGAGAGFRLIPVHLARQGLRVWSS